MVISASAMEVDNCSLSGDSSTDESDGEIQLDEGKVKCLFCDSQFPEVKELLNHCNSGHQCQLLDLCRKARLCCFGYLKMINYVRSRQINVDQLKEIFHSGVFPWESEMFLKPFDECDKLLQFDYEFHSELDGNFQPDETAQLRQAEEIIRQQQMMIEQLQMTVASLRDANLHTLMEGVSMETPSNLHRPVAMLDDKSYFDSYAQVHIHGEMIRDKVRTDSYRKAIVGNPNLFKDKVVLDVGCGTGILSMFAADSGAKKVYSVDMSDIAFSAMEIIRENGYEDRISILHQKVEDVKIEEKVDVIISEWMGYFLLFECMLEPVLVARDQLLRADGVVLPDKFRMFVSAVSDPQLFKEQIDFWDDVYGYKMTCMKKDLLDEAHVLDVKPETVVSESHIIREFDLNDRNLTAANCCEFEGDFSLTVKTECEVTSLAVYFDCGFDRGCDNKVEFSTGPFHESTHWKQTAFPLLKKIPTASGGTLVGSISVRKDPKDNHALLVSLIVNGNRSEYHVR